MKTTECTCVTCGIIFQKPTNEYNRSNKRGRLFYCSRRCAGIANLKSNNFGGKRNIIPPTKTQETNPFKYYLRSCLKRNKDCDLDLQYLADLWKKQEGKCIYTNFFLNLNTNSYKFPDVRYTASLDRIDSSIGYLKGNVQFVSISINYMKNTLTHQQTVEFLQQIAKSIIP